MQAAASSMQAAAVVRVVFAPSRPLSMQPILAPGAQEGVVGLGG